jgi:hypothetical protein
MRKRDSGAVYPGLRARPFPAFSRCAAALGARRGRVTRGKGASPGYMRARRLKAVTSASDSLGDAQA